MKQNRQIPNWIRYRTGNTKNLNNKNKDKDKDKEEDSIKLLNIKKIEKDYIEAPINITERRKKEFICI